MSHVVMNPKTRIPHHHKLERWGGRRPHLDYPSRPVLAWLRDAGSEEEGNYQPEGWYLWTVAKGWVQQTTLDGYSGSHGSKHTGPHRICAYSGQVDHPTTEGNHSQEEGCEIVVIDHKGLLWSEPAHFSSAFDLHCFKNGIHPTRTKQILQTVE